MTSTQPSLFTGQQLKEIGMQQAIDHADSQPPYNWSEKAFKFICSWLDMVPAGYQFLAEDIRQQAEHSRSIPLPPSRRAYGSLMVKARNMGLIKAIGTEKVRNPLAHQANATVWQKL